MGLEADQPHEDLAKYWLRNKILVCTTEADAAWKILKDKAIGLAKRKSGVERAELQRTLISAGLALHALRSYEADIERLRQQTHTNLRALMRFSRIRYDGIDITIRREYEAILGKEAETGSLVVIGDAGCGKSGLLAMFANQAQTDGRHVIVLNASELAAASLGQLRAELALEHELIEVIEQWHGDGAAFLVIDALDSARDERTAATLRRLIERVQLLDSRWRVVATIRKFDLKNGKHWQQVIPGNGIRPHFDPAFDDVRHLNIGILTTADIESLKDSAPALHALVTSAPPAVAELLRVPFNLMLANELRLTGGTKDLNTVTTQLDLLDRCWDQRVSGSFGERTAYEGMLRDVTEAMLGARRLHVQLASVAASPALETMLSRTVLVEQANRLQYAHHILFDYAVERLLLRPSSEDAVARIEKDRDLPIAIGPSLKFWLEGTWERDPTRNEFWALSLRLASSNVPAIAKLVSGTVAAEKTEAVGDCDALIVDIATEAGQRVFMFVADAITANMVRIARKRPNAWLFVLDRVASTAPPAVLHRGAFLLHALLDAIPDPTIDEFFAAGRFARAALARAWSTPVRNRSFVIAGIRAVARTFRSDLPESEALLRYALAAQHVQQHGHEELLWLARSAEQFMVAPAFLIDLYATTFQATASADEQTMMSTSQIFGLISNKKQDLEASHWELAQQFAAIVQNDIGLGTAIAVRLANQYAAHEDADVVPSVTFEIQGTTATLHVDRYLPRLRARDEEPEIVKKLVQQLAKMATDPAQVSELPELMRFIARNNRASLFWGELIEAMERSPEMFLTLQEMLLSKDALSFFSRQFIPVLRAHETLLSTDARAKTEAAILALRDSGYGDVTAFRLLEALGPNSLSHESLAWLEEQDRERARAAAERQHAVANDGDVEDEPDDGAGAYLLREGGMTADDLNAQANKTARRRTKELQSHLAALKEAADGEALRSIEQELRGLLEYIETESVHAAQTAATWGAIAEAATALAERGLDSIADVLVQASRQATSVYDERFEEEFTRHPGWASGQARLEAAPGLMAVAGRSDLPDVINAIRELARDKVSAVRFQVGRALPVLADRHREQYWELLDSLAQDTNTTVVRWLHWGHALWLDAPYGLALLVRTYERWLPHRKEQTALVEALFTGLLHHSLRTSAPTASAIVDAAADVPITYQNLVCRAVVSLRNTLTMPQKPEEQTSANDGLRRRSIAYVARVASNSAKVFRQLAEKSLLTETEREQFGDAAKLLRNIAEEIYFASLAYDEEHQDRKGKPDRQVRVRFYKEASSILRDLVAIGMAGSAHYVIETLRSYIDLVDPTELFLLIAEAVRARRKGGYQYEELAVKEIVAIVERYLADFRVIFMDSADCRAALRDVLDTFVEAGWPESHRLVYSLDTIFR